MRQDPAPAGELGVEPGSRSVIAPSESRQAVTILGMHRCGTSLTARVLNLLGLDLGPDEDFLEPQFDNPRGYWEQRPIMEVNDAIFEALGGTWYRPPDMPSGWHRRPEVEELKPRAREIIAAQFGEARAWGWKDPRTSLTLPFWREIVPDARYVVCFRRPTDVLASLLRREPNTHTPDSANRLWLRYSAEALENTNGDERLLLFYEDYFTDRNRQLARLADFVGLSWRDVSDSLRDEVESVVDADLRHHRTSAAEVAEAADVPLEARAFFLSLRLAQLPPVDGNSELAEHTEPGLTQAIENFLPRLRHAVSARESFETVQAERDGARRAEREHRVALDRALEELESLRGDPDATQEEKTKEIERQERALVRAQSALEGERRARAQLQDSLSWRLTRPLRWGKRALSRSA